MIDALRRSWNRVLAVFRREPLDLDLDAEIAAHLDAAVQDNLRLGMPPEEARRAALVRFGGVARAMEQHREARGLPALDLLRQDLRFTFRALRRDRSFACVVILVLALGVGANVAVFSVVNTILLRPLPFRSPNQLVWFAANGGKGGLSDQTYTVSAFEEFQRHNRSFQDVTSYQTFFNSIQYKLTGRGEPQPVVGIQVAENFFPMLGIQPSLGRLFTPDECRKGGPRRGAIELPVLAAPVRRRPRDRRAHHHHQRRARRHHRPRHRHRRPSRLLRFRLRLLTRHAGGFLRARLHGFLAHLGEYSGRSRPPQARCICSAQAQAETDLLFPQLRAAHKDWFSDYKSSLSSLQERVSGKLRRSLVVLWCAVGMILLIVCINVSNLMLARAVSRGKEFALRTRAGRRTRPAGSPVAHRESDSLGRRAQSSAWSSPGPLPSISRTRTKWRCPCSPPSAWMARLSPGRC